jgi:hypothetical protein
MMKKDTSLIGVLRPTMRPGDDPEDHAFRCSKDWADEQTDLAQVEALADVAGACDAVKG